MAIFPDTDMEVFEKYPDSRRLDHPDFADVAATTYAKGVITEFEQTGDDPIRVESRVKVQVEATESAKFIPLFYHPKAQYWDDGGLATAYNNAGYFEKAWMSFRGDDEVAVMLKEGEPVAVMGFADGVPRIGEEVLQFETVDPFRWRMSKDEHYPSENGPDGLSLGLLQEAELISDESGEESSITQTIQFDRTATLDTVLTDMTMSGPTVIIFDGVRKDFYMVIHDTWTNEHLKMRPRAQIHLAKVGPILYLIVSWFNSGYRIVTEEGSSGPARSTYHKWCEHFHFCIYPWAGCMPPDPPAEVNTCENFPFVEAQVAADLANENAAHYTSPGFNLSDYAQATVAFVIYAAPYSDELYEETKDNPPAFDFISRFVSAKTIPDPPTGFVRQWGQQYNIHDHQHEYSDHHKVDSEGGMKLYTRPHTKEELQEAGMWPAT
jgi:hypothetical protein